MLESKRKQKSHESRQKKKQANGRKVESEKHSEDMPVVIVLSCVGLRCYLQIGRAHV